MGGRVLVFPALQEFEEFLCSPLLEKPHQRALDCLHLRAWYFGDLAITVYEAASDLLELKVTSDIGMDKDLGELARGNDEFGNKVNSVVTVASKLCRG